MNKIKEFFTENIHILKKFWINQITMSLFGVMITWPCSAFVGSHKGTDALFLFAAAFACGFFCFLVYDVFFQVGMKDSVKIKHNEMEKDNFFGLKLALTAYIPTIFFGLCGFISYFANWAKFYGVCSVAYNFVIHAMTSGLFLFCPANIQPYMFIVGLLPGLFFCFLGYFLGIRDKTLRQVFHIPVKPKKTK